MLTLVTYDISEDKPRTKLARHLQRYGLKRIQYSGFVGELNPNDRFILTKELKQYATTEMDSIYIIPLCERCYRLCTVISEREISLKDASEIKIV